MRRFTVFAVAALCLAAAPAALARDIDERAAMAADGELEVSNVSGSVEIRGWDRNEVHVTGTLDDNAQELIFETNGRRTRVEVKLPRDHRRSRGSDLVIRVPATAEVVATTVSADLKVEDIRGAQRLQTVSGDLDTSVWSEDVEVKSVSGDIDVVGNDTAGSLSVNTVSGDIDVRRVRGELTISSVSGDLEAAGARLARLRAKTVSGDIEMEVALETDARADLETVNGDVTLRLANRDDIEFDLESFNGHIKDVFGQSARRTSKYAPGNELRITVGTGSTRVRIETLNGDIDIRSPGDARSEVRNLKTAGDSPARRRIAL